MAVENCVLDGWDPAKPIAVGTETFDAVADLDATGTVTARRLFGAEFDDLVGKQVDGTVGSYSGDRQDKWFIHVDGKKEKSQLLQTRYILSEIQLFTPIGARRQSFR